MATALSVPSVTRTNRPVAISGTEFDADADVTITVGPAGFSFIVTADANGDFDASTVATWAPAKTGVYTITASDGNNSESSTLQVFSTT